MGKTESPRPFVPLDLEAEIHKTRRRLPHWLQAGCTYFVTFRLADSIPAERLAIWRKERDAWLKHNPEPWSATQRRIYSERFEERFQEFLDAGYGACVLRDPKCASIVEGSIRHFDDSRYDLADYVVMPNHVHGLVRPLGDWSLSKILQAWKGFTAKQVNDALKRTGALWMDESFDHIVRGGEHFQYLRAYIRDNPVRAGLAEGAFRLGCGMWNPT